MDIWCYLAGMLTALAMYAAPGVATKWGVPTLTGWMPLLTLVAVLIFLAHRSKDWLWANIAFDRAQLPFVSRFVLNARPPEDKIREEALAFATRREKGSGTAGRGVLHYYWPAQEWTHDNCCRAWCGSTSANFAAAQCRRLNDTLQASGSCGRGVDGGLHKRPIRTAGKRPAWPPEVAELLMVDDVGAQGAKGPLLSPAQFQSELKTNNLLREICDKKHVIWVIGDNPESSQEWIAAIKTAFAQGSEPRVVPPIEPRVLPPIELNAPIPRAERLRSSQQRARMSAYGT